MQPAIAQPIEIGVQHELHLLASTMYLHGISFEFAQQLLRRQMILEALERHDWKVPRAAEDLGLHRNHVNRLIHEMGIRKPEQKHS